MLHFDISFGFTRIKVGKQMLDKDSIFFWRLFQDIFKVNVFMSLCHLYHLVHQFFKCTKSMLVALSTGLMAFNMI